MKKLAPNSISSESKQNRPVLAKISETIMAAEKNSSEHVGPAAPHHTIPSQTVESVQSHAPSKPHPTALSNILDPTNKQTTSPKKVPEKQLSPFQSYVMSDREDSDSDSESDEEDEPQRPKKSVSTIILYPRSDVSMNLVLTTFRLYTISQIPEWAERKNLLAALEEQYADGPNRLDPDKIFGEVLTCNLEEIFDKKKSRYQRRTSSGNWTKDHVTFHEKLTYKRTMGYEKK